MKTLDSALLIVKKKHLRVGIVTDLASKALS